MDWKAWMSRWLTRHPMKAPLQVDRTRYTAQVMTRVRALGVAPSAAPVASPWWPRLGLVFATAAVLLVVGVVGRRAGSLARQTMADVEFLAILENQGLEPLLPDDADALAAELELADTFQLAETVASDEAWLEQTLQLLEETDDASALGEEPVVDEEWLQELQTLDEQELTASS